MMRCAVGSTLRRAAATCAVIPCVAFILAIIASRSSSLPPKLDPTDARVSLSDIERSVAAIYSVPEIAVADVAGGLGREDVVFFDVRDRREFETSHLPGAIPVAPDMTAEDFVGEHGERLAGRIVVFYCSVGVRSGRMLERVRSAIAPYRPAAAYNLRGGLFRWFAEGGAVENANGPATIIHPYDDAWRDLLRRTLEARR